jgi:tetratricopeptide (TPR) repeat protein
MIGLPIKSATAEVIDRIQINQAGDEAEIRIQFITRIQYLRQVLLKNGDIRIYFNLLEIDATDPRLVQQRRDSPPSNIAPHFTLNYPEIDSSMSISFGRSVDYHVRPGNDGMSISIFTPDISLANQLKAKSPLPAAGAKPPRTAEEMAQTEQQAKQLMESARTELKSNSNREAIADLKKLLELPPNLQSQTAQLMLGQTYERIGEFANARATYLAYVTLYPNANNYQQVKDSLYRMVMAAYTAEQSTPEKLPVENKLIVFGGFSQYYYRGLLHTDTMTLPNPVVTSADINDQSQLLSTLDLTGMRRSETRETRMVFRDTYTANFLPDGGNSNTLNAAYFEQTPNDQSYYYGMGRQTGASGGVPSRFDGAWLGSNLNDSWRINSTLGKPVQEPGVAAESKSFAAININLTRQPGRWSGNTYLISQHVDDIMDRRAVGLEAHYFDTKSNDSVLIEYDNLFRTVNVGLIQGNWTSKGGDNYTLLAEHRRLPSLQTTNALLLYPSTQTISDLFNSGVSADTLRTYALMATPILNQFSVGLTQPISPHIKFGGDFKVSNTTSYQTYDSVNLTTTVIPGVRAYTVTIQVVGNDLLFENELGIASASYAKANTYKAETLTFSQVETFGQNWRLDLVFQLYNEINVLNGNTTTISPTLKLSYQMSPSKHFELAGGYLQTHTSNTILDVKTRRRFINLGYRWDFQ